MRGSFGFTGLLCFRWRLRGSLFRTCLRGRFLRFIRFFFSGFLFFFRFFRLYLSGYATQMGS